MDNTQTRVLETPYQKARRERNNAIKNDFHELMSVPGQNVTSVIQHLMTKYGVGSTATIYTIVYGKDYRRKTK